MPAVSTRRSRTEPTSTVSSTVSRVVPGSSVTMTRWNPARAFSKLDLPTLGLPKITARTPLAQHLPPGDGRQQSLQGSLGTGQTAGIRSQAELVNVLVRVVQYGVKMAAQVCEGVIDRLQPADQGALHLPRRIGGGLRSLRLDEVNDRLRLGQVHPAVQKRPLGELPPAGRLGPRLVQSLNPAASTAGEPWQ